MFKRKFIDHIRYVSALDPCVKSGHDEYVSSHYDASKLVLTDGEQPSVFVLCPLTARQMMLVGSSINERHRWMQELQLSLKGIENYQVETQSGSVIDTMLPERESGSEIGKPVKLEWLDQMHLSVELLEELSTVINRISGPLVS